MDNQKLINNLSVSDTWLDRLEENLFLLSNSLELIQSHGILLGLTEPEFTIIKISTNSQNILQIPPEKLLEKNLDILLEPSEIFRLKEALYHNFNEGINNIKIRIKISSIENNFNAIFHRIQSGILILELEPEPNYDNNLQDFYYSIKKYSQQLEKISSFAEMTQTMVEQIRKISGFDRVMMYKFDEEGHGAVIAETKAEELEPFLGLHFPAADTYACKKAMIVEGVRAIPDVRAQPVEIRSALGKEEPLDLTFSVLRGVSYCHREYLNNMGVRGTLVISLLKNEKNWGFISCHNYSPKFLSYEVREACKFLGQIMSKEIVAEEQKLSNLYQNNIKNIKSKLIEYMSEEQNFIQGLIEREHNLLDLVTATGAAICWNDDYHTIGKTPELTEIKLLVEWLKKNKQEQIVSTHCLSSLYPEAEKFKDTASGLLAIYISPENYIFWFRGELVKTVNWAGNPERPFMVETIESDNNLRLSPRTSFATWQQIVNKKSLPWQECEIQIVESLRQTIIKIILERTNKLSKLTNELKRSNAELEKFAYIASHDLQEPLTVVSSYVQLLEMRYRDLLDESAKEYIKFAVDGVEQMQTLIDDLLTYSRVDSKSKVFKDTNLEQLFSKILNNFQAKIETLQAVVTHDPLPTVEADSTQMLQLLQNLIGNAIKFHSQEAPKIHLSVRKKHQYWLFCLQDNGIGIESQFFERIFVIFQRLHARDEYPGTGIGLAICKKIVERHGGKMWLESCLGKGSKFFWTLPVEKLRYSSK